MNLREKLRIFFYNF